MNKHNTNNLLEKNLRFIEGLHATPPPPNQNERTPPPVKRTKRTPPPPPRRPQRPQIPPIFEPVARSPVQIFTNHQEAIQSAAEQGNIVIPTYIAITPSYINRFSSYQPVQVKNNGNFFGGRRSRKRNNKKRNIKTKKQYQS